MSKTCVIIGASHAGIHLAASLRQQGWEGRILMLGEEALLPYQRPPLSKTYLLGDGDVPPIYPQDSYIKQAIDYRLTTRVIAIDRGAKQVLLDSGERIAYDKLALCCGARLRRLPLPGAELDNVFYLREVADARRLRAQLPQAQNAVIIGAGYIGLEIAASLRQKGLAVTVLEAAPRVLARVGDEQLSSFYSRLHEEHGVAVHCSTQVQALEGTGQVSGVVCNDGKHYLADLVVIGIGVIPNTKLAADAGLVVGDGILVDEYACTDDPDIVAAGDCALHPSHHGQRLMRLECVANAVDQARTAAASICGRRIPHHNLPWFWSEQFDVRLQIAGLAQEDDRVVLRGDLHSRSFVLFYLQGDLMRCAVCVNRAKEFIASKHLISEKIPVDAIRLTDDSLDFKSLLLPVTATV